MSAVSIADAWPSWGEPFTVEDLDRMPDDGRRYELIDGMLIVSPGPRHASDLVSRGAYARSLVRQP